VQTENYSIYFLMNMPNPKEKYYSDIQINFSKNLWKPCNPYHRAISEFLASIFTNLQVFKVTACTSPIREFLPNEPINMGKFIVLITAEIHLHPQ
jgi:hypothetical protein